MRKRFDYRYMPMILCMLALLFAGIMVGCNTNSTGDADKAQVVATKRAMAEANRQLGMPNIDNFQQRRLMKMILEECDKEGLVCYAYLHSEYTGQLLYLGKCVGYGVPFSAQYTNPMRTVNEPQGGDHTLPQPDPNGLFMPTSSDATWILLVDPKTNEPRVCYGEPKLFISPFSLPPGPAVIGGP